MWKRRPLGESPYVSVNSVDEIMYRAGQIRDARPEECDENIVFDMAADWMTVGVLGGCAIIIAIGVLVGLHWLRWV